MKPFNLDLAIEGKPIVTRTGTKVTEFYLFKTIDSPSRFVCSIGGVLRSFYCNGRYLTNEETENDLFMEEPEQWVNVYWTKEHGIFGSSLGQIYLSEKSAKNGVDDFDNYQTTIKLK